MRPGTRPSPITPFGFLTPFSLLSAIFPPYAGYMNAPQTNCLIAYGHTIHSCPVEVREKLAVSEVRFPLHPSDPRQQRIP